MKVLSLFDGMACGMIAMLESGIEVDRYVAYEVDKYAIKTATHNFPMIEQKGDVFTADFTEYAGFDWVLAGFPCTKFSIAQKNGRETKPYSGEGWDLFEQAWRAVQEAKPKYFLLENNKSMAKAVQQEISKIVGFSPVLINSALVSAQNRQRLYWVGKRNADGTYSKVNVEQPIDRGILLKDVLDDSCLVDREKAYVLKHQAGNARDYFKKHHTQIKFEPVNPTADGKSQTIKAQYQQNNEDNFIVYAGGTFGASGVAEPVAMRCRGGKDKNGNSFAKYECRKDQKANVVDTNTANGSLVAEPIYIGEIPEHNGQYRNGKQPSQQYRVYSIEGKSVAVDRDSRKNIAEPVIDWTYSFLLDDKLMASVKRVYESLKDTFEAWKQNSNVNEPLRVGSLPRPNGELSTSQAMRIYSTDGKSVNINSGDGGMGGKTGLYAIPVEFDGDIPIKAVSQADGKTYRVHKVENGLINIKGKDYPIKLADGYYIIRKLTVRECMRLQTVPEWYEFPVSDCQAYKMLGNGWTCEVIIHLIKACLESKTEDEPVFAEQIKFF